MKVTIIHTDFRIYWPSRLEALSVYLERKFISLDIIEIAGKGTPYEFAGKSNESKLNWHILFSEEKMENINSYSIQKKLYALLDKINPDILLSGAIAFPSGALSVAWAMKHKKKIICFDDAKIESVKRSRFVNFIKQQIYNGVYAMLYPSPDWDETGKFWNFKKEQLFYGIDVVDNSFWENDIIYSVSKSKGLPYLLAVGRQIPKKNFILIAEAYNLYYKRYKEKAYPILFVGEGPEHNKLQCFIQDNNLTSKAKLLPFLSQMDLKSIYHNAAALIIASNKEETWGLVINEAMACGLPIIASNQCGATNTLVKDKINGYVFAPDINSSLFSVLCEFHNTSEKQKKSMCVASKNIIQNWDLDRFCESCYNAILYVTNVPLKKISVFNKFIINSWKGKYNPI